LDVLERLADKFTIGDNCWEWTAGCNNSGYGIAYVAPGKQKVAHRALYEELVGSIPEGLDLDHLCRNRRCVRPDHLEPVTRRENLRRGRTLAAVNTAKTHCHLGHELTAANVYLRPDRPGRLCRACRRLSDSRRRGR
jgi:hypothetical protein